MAKLPEREPDYWFEIDEKRKAGVWQTPDHFVICWEEEGKEPVIYAEKPKKWVDLELNHKEAIRNALLKAYKIKNG